MTVTELLTPVSLPEPLSSREDVYVYYVVTVYIVLLAAETAMTLQVTSVTSRSTATTQNQGSEVWNESE